MAYRQRALLRKFPFWLENPTQSSLVLGAWTICLVGMDIEAIECSMLELYKNPDIYVGIDSWSK